MITVNVGNIEATLTDRTWTSDSESVARMLSDMTEAVFLHGGIPDVEEAIIQALSNDLPLKVISRTPPAEPGDADGVIF